MNQTIPVRVSGKTIQIPPAVAMRFRIEPGQALSDKDAMPVMIAAVRARRDERRKAQ